MKVFVFDPLWPELLTEENKAQLKQAGAVINLTTEIKPLSECPKLFEGDEPRILAVNPDYVSWSLPADQFKDIPNLKTIITASTSHGWIDSDFAAGKNIAVANIRNFSTQAVADWAIMMMLNVARKVPLLMKDNFPLNYGSDFHTYQGINITGKKVGIIGMGHIGKAIAERCQGLGMNVAYWNRSELDTPYTKSSLETIFKESDIIFPCLRDSEETKHIITDDMLRSMKNDAIFVSVVHKYYNHDMILERVANGTLYGYGFETEAASFSKYTGNVWAAPSYAWCTNGSLRGAMDLFVKAIADAAQSKHPNKVN